MPSTIIASIPVTITNVLCDGTEDEPEISLDLMIGETNYPGAVGFRFDTESGCAEYLWDDLDAPLAAQVTVSLYDYATAWFSEHGFA